MKKKVKWKKTSNPYGEELRFGKFSTVKYNRDGNITFGASYEPLITAFAGYSLESRIDALKDIRDKIPRVLDEIAKMKEELGDLLQKMEEDENDN